jgi:hypothetical protein
VAISKKKKAKMQKNSGTERARRLGSRYRSSPLVIFAPESSYTRAVAPRHRLTNPLIADLFASLLLSVHAAAIFIAERYQRLPIQHLLTVRTTTYSRRRNKVVPIVGDNHMGVCRGRA